MTTNLEEQTVVVRRLRPDDLEAVVALDAKNTGRKRDEYFKVKLEQNLAETGIQVSLAAELDGAFVGFLLARVFYGEFGTMEQVAVLDTFAAPAAADEPQRARDPPAADGRGLGRPGSPRVLPPRGVPAGTDDLSGARPLRSPRRGLSRRDSPGARPPRIR